MLDRHEHQTTELHQQHSGDGDNVGRDKIIHNHLYGSVDYQQLIEAIKDGEELLAGIAPDRIDLCEKQSVKLEKLRKQRDDFKAQVFYLYELFTCTPINTERLRQAKAHFDRGEFREADAVLNVKEINAEAAQLKARRKDALETVAAMDRDLAELANEFLLKARLSSVNPAAEGESTLQRTEQLFEQALATARTAEVLLAYAFFLGERNLFRKAEPLYQEALKQIPRDGDGRLKALPETLTLFLLVMSISFLEDLPCKAKSVAYAQEVRSILMPLCAQAPHLQKYLDEAERLLKANAATPAA